MLEKDVRDFFFKTKENYNLIAGQKEFNVDGLRIDPRYTNTILPLLKRVSAALTERYGAQGLYPHISYFNKLIMLRLGPDKKQSHRASIAVTFGDSVRSGFDLTHALPDGQALKAIIKRKLNKITQRLLALNDYTIWIPNTGIRESISIENLDLKGMTLLLKNYDPQAMRECYFTIDRWYEEDSLTEADILDMFETEYQTFSFLLNDIVNRG